MPSCGVLGDKELFDYFLDANVTAAALTGTAIDFPDSLAAGQAYAPAYRRLVLSELPLLGTGFVAGNPAGVALTPLGQAWAGTVSSAAAAPGPASPRRSRTGRASASPPLTDVPFLFGVYPGLTGGTVGVAAGNVTDNRRTVYRIEDRYGPLHRGRAAR